MPLALLVCRFGGPAHTPTVRDRPELSLPCCQGPAEEQAVLGELALWAARPAHRSLVAPSSRRSLAPEAPHLRATSSLCAGAGFPRALPVSGHVAVSPGAWPGVGSDPAADGTVDPIPTLGFGILGQASPHCLGLCSPRGNRQSSLSKTNQPWTQFTSSLLHEPLLGMALLQASPVSAPPLSAIHLLRLAAKGECQKLLGPLSSRGSCVDWWLNFGGRSYSDVRLVIMREAGDLRDPG